MADGADERVEKHLKDLAVTDSKKQSLGKKQLAYPIKKVVEAEYFLWTFEAEGAAVNQLDNKLRLEQELILRHLLTVFDPKKAAKTGRVSSVSGVSKVSGAEQKVEEVEEPKAKPKVTVTTKIVAVVKSQPPKASLARTGGSVKEPKESEKPKAKGKVDFRKESSQVESKAKSKGKE